MRNLYERIIEYNGEKLYDDILIPWINNNNYKEYLKNIEGLLLENKDIAIEDSWELYALSRVLDIMTLRFQLNNKADGNNWLGPELKLKEYENFINLLGLTLKENIEYNSFYCEIIDAIDGNDDFKIIENYHPPIILGNLLIKKGGVKITLNTQKYNLSIINNSTLYWAYRRKNRRHQDLSHGWGSNSQWRTEFRFDFDYGNTFVYNSKGKIDLSMPNKETLFRLKEDNLTLKDAVELTVNRHFVTSEKTDNDLFPYNYKYTTNSIDRSL